MTMTPYSTDLTRALKWMHNNAPNITSLIQQKAAWYAKYNDGFWSNWETNVYDIRTANAFGLVVWCIILGLPLSIFDFEPITNAFAYGSLRGNFIDGGGHVGPITFVTAPVFYANGVQAAAGSYTLNESTDEITYTAAPAQGAVLSWKATIEGPTGQELIVNQARQFATGDGTTVAFSLIPTDAANYNTVGDNFYGGGSESVALLGEIRYACQLRYAALVSNGRQAWINQMLQYIFNAGEAWDFPGKNYFYLHDQTGAVQNIIAAALYKTDWAGQMLLSSSERTNYIWPSNEIAASNSWTITGATVANSDGPDGTANGAATITPSAAGTAGTASPTNFSDSLPLNNTFTTSLYIKAGTATNSQVATYAADGTTVVAGAKLTWANGVPAVSSILGDSVTASIAATGVSGWYRLQYTFNNGTNSTLKLVVEADTDLGVGTLTVAYPQGELGTVAGEFILTTTGPVTLTDYTLDTSTGAVVMAPAPAEGATLDWNGTWNWASTNGLQSFGTGDGTTTDFTLSQAPGAVAPITKKYYMEYRVGANLNLSAQFLNLLNNPAYGIMPQCAGTAYAVVQED